MAPVDGVDAKKKDLKVVEDEDVEEEDDEQVPMLVMDVAEKAKVLDV